MDKGLDVKKLRSICKINKIIKDKRILQFKIGQTGNFEERKSGYINEGYTNFYEIAECNNSDESDKLERDLINHFRTNIRCVNINEGGVEELLKVKNIIFILLQNKRIYGILAYFRPLFLEKSYRFLLANYNI